MRRSLSEQLQQVAVSRGPADLVAAVLWRSEDVYPHQRVGVTSVFGDLRSISRRENDATSFHLRRPTLAWPPRYVGVPRLGNGDQFVVALYAVFETGAAARDCWQTLVEALRAAADVWILGGEGTSGGLPTMVVFFDVDAPLEGPMGPDGLVSAVEHYLGACPEDDRTFANGGRYWSRALDVRVELILRSERLGWLARRQQLFLSEPLPLGHHVEGKGFHCGCGLSRPGVDGGPLGEGGTVVDNNV